MLFADLAGSTALGEAHDPETLRHILGRYFDSVSRVLERHGGTVEKFIGDAVVAVFGVPVAQEDDALRAVRAAAELRSALAGLNEELAVEWGIRLAVRIGVNTGEVVAGDHAAGQTLVTGDAVNVAARLEQAAASGEILIGPGTERLVRTATRLEALMPLALRGRDELAPAWRLLEVFPHGVLNVHASLLSSIRRSGARCATARVGSSRFSARPASASLAWRRSSPKASPTRRRC